MKTFNESVQAKINLRKIESCFTQMSMCGVDPNKFVDWYFEEGLEKEKQGILPESSIEWIQDELFLIEGWGDRWRNGVNSGESTGPKRSPVAYGVGRAMGGATELGGQAKGWLKGQSGDIGRSFMTGVNGQSYNNIPNPAPQTGQTPNTTAPQTPNTTGSQTGQAPNNTTPQTGQAPNNTTGSQTGGTPSFASHAQAAYSAISNLSKRLSQSKTLQEKLGPQFQQFQTAITQLMNYLQNPNQMVQAYESTNSMNNFAAFNDKIKFRHQIKSGLIDLQQNHGIDPVKFVDWYIEEGQHLNEAWYDGIANTWSNIKDAWGNVKKGWGAAGRQRQANVDNQRDGDAINQAMQALDQLDQGMNGTKPTADFANALSQVRNSLNSINPSQQQQAQAQPEPEQQIQQDEPEQQAPEPMQQQQIDPIQQSVKNIKDVLDNYPPDLHGVEIPKILASAEKSGIDKNALSVALKEKGIDPAKVGLPQPEISDDDWMQSAHSSQADTPAVENKINKMPFYDFLKRRTMIN